MKKLLIMIVCLFVASCAKQKAYKFDYQYNENTMSKSSVSLDKTLYIQEFSDYRGTDGRYQTIWDGIPLNPSYITFRDRPENRYIKDSDSIMYKDLNYDIEIESDLSKATAESIVNSSILKIAEKSENSDYILQGRILEFKRETKNYLYGLSGLAPIAQILFAAPVAKDTFSIRINFSLIDNKTNQEIFSKMYKEEKQITLGIYYGDHNEVLRSFENIYQKINNKLIYDLDVLFSKK